MSFCEETYLSEALDDPAQFWRALKDAPKLTKVTLHDLSFGMLPYHEPRSLDLHEATEGCIMTLFENLTTCKNQQSLSLWGLQDEDVVPSDPLDLGCGVATPPVSSNSVNNRFAVVARGKPRPEPPSRQYLYLPYYPFPALA